MNKLQKCLGIYKYLCFLFIFQTFYAVITYSKDFYVSDESGSNIKGNGSLEKQWETIQYALNNVPDGTESEQTNIHVQPGTYFGGVKITSRKYISLLGSSASSTKIAGQKYLNHGDLNGDGSVTKADAYILQELIVGNRVPTPIEFQQGDINDDSKLTVHDVVKLLTLLDSPGVQLGNSQNIVVSDFTIIGFVAAIGGGIRCDDSFVTIKNNIINKNLGGDRGGGISCYGGNVTIINNTIKENSANLIGGGIDIVGSTVSIAQNTITKNIAQQGGGIFCNGFDKNISIRDNIITENLAGTGGGINCHGYNSITITNNVITENSASIGGGIYCLGTITITKNTISNNSAGTGGGIKFSHGEDTTTLIITDNIISNNSASEFGGGVYGSYGQMTDATEIIQGGRITGNYAKKIGGGVIYSSYFTTLNASVYGNTCDYAPPEGYSLVQDVCNILDMNKPYIIEIKK